MFIDVNIRGQELTASDIILAEGSLNKLFCRVTADSEWDGLSVRFIYRNVNATGIVEREVIANDLSSVPVAPECIRNGYLFITAVGVADGGNTRLTTAPMQFGKYISPVAALIAAAPDAVTPTRFEQLLSLIGELRNAIEDIGGGIRGFYIQPDEPVDAPDGSIWLDTDDDEAGGTSGGVSKSEMEKYVGESIKAAFNAIQLAEEGAY